MQRKRPLFLAAAVAEILRFFLLGLAAEALGLLGAGGPAPAFYRYAAAPQLLFGAAFFFLWLDRSRYAAYRPLGLAGKALSLASFLPLASALLGPGGAGSLPLPGPAFAAALGLLLIDAAGLALLLLSPGLPEAAGEEGAPLAARPASGSGPQAAQAGPQAALAGRHVAQSGPRAAQAGPAGHGPHTSPGPRGPEDIEEVEV